MAKDIEFSNLSVKEITENEVSDVIGYWKKADSEYLKGMGIDIKKMPSEFDFEAMLHDQIKSSYSQKKSFATIWFYNNVAFGHCNISDISFGKEAHMHLHIWHTDKRKQGFGSYLAKESIRLFFDKMQLKKLICEPFAFNPAPSKTLEKIGFTFEKAYLTTPGSFCFEQKVNRWILKAEDFAALK